MFVIFFHGEVIAGSDYHLRRSDTPINLFACGSTLSQMVIVLRNGVDIPGSNLGRSYLCFICVNATSYREIPGRLGYLTFSTETVEKENFLYNK